MPAPDLAQTVRAVIEKSKAIPAQLDAYGEFIDSPIGKLELEHLYDLFDAFLENLAERFPDIASKRAANNARNDIVNFLSLADNDPERVKEVLRVELKPAQPTMSASISERFSKMNTDEKKAIDAALRLIRRSPVDLVFRVESGKHLADAGPDFSRFFAAVKAESHNIRELRFENLIVEKGIFNKLLLKSEKQDYSIWVPSFFAKENIDALVERVSPISEHVLLGVLKNLKAQGKLEEVRPFLSLLLGNQGVIGRGTSVPEDLKTFIHESTNGEFLALAPFDLDDTSLLELEAEEERKRRENQRLQAEREREEALKKEREQRSPQYKSKSKVEPVQIGGSGQMTVQVQITAESIYLGKKMDLEQFQKALARRVSEKEFSSQVRETGDFYWELPVVLRNGLAIVGSSGSGKSMTLKRLLDGIAQKGGAPRVVVLDQKGEHRGIAWKYNWEVFAFAADSQAKEFSVPLTLSFGADNASQEMELVADLLQEWFLQSGLTCTDQQRSRIASVLKSITDQKISFESIAPLLSKEPELSQFGQRLSKNMASKTTAYKIFSDRIGFQLPSQANFLIDVSGRGLKDPTTREERAITSVLLLKSLTSSGIMNSVIVVEDVLDRFKSESLRRKSLEITSKLRSMGNTFIATSRSQIRDFVGNRCLEILHRLSGEKVVNEELAEFGSGAILKNLETSIGFLPRGYAITSQVVEEGKAMPPQAIRVEQLQFSTTQKQ